MNLQKMLEAQRGLDARILLKKQLVGHDLSDKKMIALLTELGELANEWRGFKFWSEDRGPVTKVPKSGWGEPFRNPLLEEYADSLSFFLTISIEKGWTELLYIHEEAILDIQTEGFEGGLTGAFIEMNYWLLKSYMERKQDEKYKKTLQVLGITQQEFFFKNAWFIFLAIGLIGFDFTLEQIEQAYFAKSKINHERQESGY